MKNEECTFYKDGKCIKTYEEVKTMSLSGCYTCIYNPAKEWGLKMKQFQLYECQKCHYSKFYISTNKDTKMLRATCDDCGYKQDLIIKFKEE